MNFGMDYFSLLTGGINRSTNSILNQYGKQKVGKNSKGNGIQKSYGAFSTIDNSKVFGSLYKMASKTNDKILNGASKADTAGRQLSNKAIYQDGNRESLYSNAKDLIDGYNEIVESTSNSSSALISNRASVMKRIALTNKIDLEKVGISYDFKTGALSMDEGKFKGADAGDLQRVFGTNGSFGQNVRASAVVTQNTAASSMYQQSGLAGLYNSYGMNGKYSALNNYGLSSFFGSWFI